VRSRHGTTVAGLYIFDGTAVVGYEVEQQQFELPQFGREQLHPARRVGWGLARSDGLHVGHGQRQPYQLSLLGADPVEAADMREVLVIFLSWSSHSAGQCLRRRDPFSRVSYNRVLCL
jgi:hypothetical protein